MVSAETPFGGSPGSGWQGGVEALKKGQVGEAVAQLSSFVQSNPNSFEGNNFLGIALAQAGRHPEAIEHLRQATSLNPASAQAHYNLGIANLGAQDNQQARAEFQTALQLDPGYAQAQQALDRLSPSATATSTVPDPSTPPASADLGTIGMAAPAATDLPAVPVGPGASNLVASSSTAQQAVEPTSSVSVPREPLKAADFFKALVFGTLAAVIGAFVWDKFVYYTNIQFGLIAVGVGFLVGMAVSMGASGKGALSLQILGALLACFAMLLGQALIIMDVARGQYAQETAAIGTISLFIISTLMIPQVLMDDPLTLLFIAFGIWEGWKIPGGSHDEETPAPVENTPA